MLFQPRRPLMLRVEGKKFRPLSLFLVNSQGAEKPSEEEIIGR